MSNDKLVSQISQCIESEDNYKKKAESILQGLATNPKNYTPNILEVILQAFNGSDTVIRRKFIALQLLKDCMEMRQPLFMTSVAESEIIQILRQNVIQFPKTEKQINTRFGAKADIEYAKKFYYFMLEWIKYWGEIYQDEKEPFKRFSNLYTELLGKGANFPTNFSFIKTAKPADKQHQQNTAAAAKDPKNVQKNELNPLEITASLKECYESILQQPFFYNAQELELDHEEVRPEQILADWDLQEVPAPFMYNAKELELDDDVDGVIEEDDLEHDISLRQSNQAKAHAAKPDVVPNPIKGGNTQNQSEINNQRTVVPPAHPAFDSDDSGDFDVIDTGYQGNKNLKVPAIQGFPAKQGQAVPKQQQTTTTTYAYEDKNKVIAQKDSIPKKPEDHTIANDPTKLVKAHSFAPTDGSADTKSTALKNNDINYQQNNLEERNRGQKPVDNSLKTQAKSQKDPIIAVRHRSGSLEDDIELKIDTKSIAAEKIRTPKNSTSPINVPTFTSQNQSHKDVSPIENQNRSQKISKDPIVAYRHRSGSLEDDIEARIEAKSKPAEISKYSKDASLNNQNVVQAPRAVEKDDKYKINKGDIIIRDSVKTGKDRSVSIEDDSTHKVSKIDVKVKYDPNQDQKKKKASIIINDDASFHNRSQRELMEIADRIASNNSIRDGKSFSELRDASRNDTRSFTDVNGNGKYLKVLGDNVLSNNSKMKNTASPNRQQGNNDKTEFRPILQMDSTLENYFEREIQELKKRNDKLIDENQDLKVKNAQLEVKLAQEVEKNHENKLLLEKKDMELKSTRSKLENINNISPKKALTKAEMSKVETPYGSPKSEFFRKKNIKSPKDSSVNASRPSFFQPHAPAEKPKNQAYSLATMGSFLRRKLEDDDELHEAHGERSSQIFYQTTSNILTKTEYASPKRNTASSKYTSPIQQASNRKPFYNHNDLLFSTDVERFQLACLKNKEKLFENQHIVLTVQTYLKDKFYDEEARHLGITLTFTNKTHREMDEFSVTYKSVPGFVISAETTEVDQKLNPKESQVHRLNAEMVAPSDKIGILIIEYRMDDEPFQWKLHCPIVMAKFFEFIPISSSDFIRRRKALQTQNPNNSQESPKMYLNNKHLEALKDYMFAKMTPIQADKGTIERFSLYGGCIEAGRPDKELLVRFIIENETQIGMIQVNYDEGCQDFARDYVAMLILLCNEKTVL